MHPNADASVMCSAYANITADCIWLKSNIIVNSNITNAIKSYVTDALSEALTHARKQHKPYTLHANNTETKCCAYARSLLSTMIAVGVMLVHLIHLSSN